MNIRIRNILDIQNTKNKTADVNPIALVITLNVNGLNIAIKKQTLEEWI